MRSIVACTFAVATSLMLLHCSSSDDASPHADDGGAWLDATGSDVSVDASADGDTGSSDAATDDEFEVPDTSVECDADPCVTALTGTWSQGSAGALCALLADRTVQCWGSSFNGKLGYEAPPGEFGLPMSPSPHRLADLSDVTKVSLGDDNGCVRQSDGSVFCWGLAAVLRGGMTSTGGDAGEEQEPPLLPTRLDAIPPATDVNVGGTNICVSLEDGSLSCWGRSDHFELGYRTKELWGPATTIPIGDRKVQTVVPGGPWMFSVTTTKELLSWGGGTCTDVGDCKFMLGRDTSEDPDPVPTIVPGWSNVRGVAGSTSAACAIVGRQVQCWGENDSGQLGLGFPSRAVRFPTTSIVTATADADPDGAGTFAGHDVPIQVVSDFLRGCAVMGSGRVYCWGNDGPQGEWGRPKRITGLHGPVVALASVGMAKCALLRSGVVECWGRNFLGLLGRGIEDYSFSDDQPQAVTFER
jgi:alpha-tubulin suppressor-like RCC1 family protein